MPIVRLTRTPSSSCCQVAARVATTRSATMFIASSRPIVCQSAAYGGRYSTS